jgi:hypothetical protein
LPDVIDPKSVGPGTKEIVRERSTVSPTVKEPENTPPFPEPAAVNPLPDALTTKLDGPSVARAIEPEVKVTESAAARPAIPKHRNTVPRMAFRTAHLLHRQDGARRLVQSARPQRHGKQLREPS